jgi:5'-methylthioadenosine/S-adenosylhomocysteine nucleosidase
MKTNRIAILAALKDEMAGLKQRTRTSERFRKGKILAGCLSGKDILLVETGVGPTKAGNMARFLVENFQIDFIISIGFAGGVKEYLKVGDLLVCDAVLCDHGETGFEDRKARGLARKAMDPGRNEEALKKISKRGIAFKKGDILTVNRVIDSAEEKKWLGATYAAEAVEMETFSIAEEAEKKGIPLIAFRAISDASHDSLVNISNLTDEKGEVSKWKAGLYAIFHPGDIPKLLAMRENSQRAEKALMEAVLAVLI